MNDIIEKHFIERIETHISVGEYIASENKPSLKGIKEQIDHAKLFMKMLNKYKRLKK